MRKERKVNIIRALKDEINFYKRQTVSVKYTMDRTELNHLRLNGAVSINEVMNTPKDILASLLAHRMVKTFEDSIKELPIETEYDEHIGVYKVNLDIWVKKREV